MVSFQGGNGQPGIDRAEHIGADNGENIEAKRVGAYVWNGSAWARMTQPGAEVSTVSKVDDTTTASVVYIGKALLTGAAISTASAVWQIKKLDTSSLALDKKWADGNDSYDNVWDNRASLTYY